MNATTLISGSYQELRPKMPLPEWRVEVVSASEVMINKLLMNLPWFTRSRDFILQWHGGFEPFFVDAMSYVIAHITDPDDLFGAMNDAVKPFAKDLRRLFDREVFSDSLDAYELETTSIYPMIPEVDTEFSPRAQELVDMLPDNNGYHIMMDIAHGTPFNHAGMNQGLSKSAAWRRLEVLRKRLEASNA